MLSTKDRALIYAILYVKLFFPEIVFSNPNNKLCYLYTDGIIRTQILIRFYVMLCYVMLKEYFYTQSFSRSFYLIHSLSF